MNTQENPVLSANAQALLAEMDKRYVKGDQLEGLKSFVETKMAENLQAILDSKKAPIVGRNSWKVRNPRTQEVHEMEYSLGKILHVLRETQRGAGFPSDSAYSREVDYVKRTITEGTAGAGGSLIPQEWTDFVIPELGAQVVFLKAGPNILPMQHQILNIPGLTNNATYTWLGENAAISETAPATNNNALTLHTLKGLTDVSIEWLRDATPETDAALQANLIRGASRAFDLAYLNGSGANTPTGMANVSGIVQNFAGNGVANGSTITLDDLSNAIYGLENANAPREGRSWFMHPRTLNEIRLMRDTLGRPLFIDNLQRENLVGPNAVIPALFRGADGFILGYPVFTSTQIPVNQTRGTATTASFLLLVAMSDMYVGQGVKSQGLEVAISDQALFANAQIAIRLLYRTDVQPGHAVSICSVAGIL